VPAKYKQIGDFHEYYSGQRVAPFLTVFIGGNHEAGNYLLELYYGGWVAPNIYFLGAANTLRFGPLRISGMSGIWKGYDYRKPHFERLPMNGSDIQSIYHVRELDVRKLLQIRSQVDIGLSHDWPRAIEKHGNFRRLFNQKRGFEEDSLNGTLGNQAAREVFDYLRPSFWFSAHLHVRFTAEVQHNKTSLGPVEASSHKSAVSASDAPAADVPATDVLSTGPHDDQKTVNHEGDSSNSPRGLFNNGEIRQATGTEAERLAAWNNFHSVAQRDEARDAKDFIQQYKQHQESEYMRPMVITETSVIKGVKRTIVRGSDGQPTDLSDDDQRKVENTDKVSLDSSPESTPYPQSRPEPVKPLKARTVIKEEGANVDNDDRISLGSSPVSTTDVRPGSVPAPPVEKVVSAYAIDSTVDNNDSGSEDDLLGALGNQLPGSLDAPPPKPQKQLPADITNLTTKFLALDKPLPRDQFVELFEIEPISKQHHDQAQRPYRLQYDPEWLSICRVFANELELGNPAARGPAHKGDDHYKHRIDEERAWIDEHVVKTDRLDIPYNFVQTAPPYDESVPINTDQQPPEYTNPQTTYFCDLIGIENKFDLSAEERQARANAGPRPDSFRGNFRGGRHNNHRGGRGRGRGHHSRGNRGRGGRGGYAGDGARGSGW
jgi:lariat debranching enzyme